MSFVITHCPFCSKRIYLEANSQRFTQCITNEDGHTFSVAYKFDERWSLEHYIVLYNDIKVYWQEGDYTVINFPPKKLNEVRVGDLVLNFSAPAPTPEQQLAPKELTEKMKMLVIFQ
jgi:hypothetical protein